MIECNISFRKLNDTKEDYLKLYNWCRNEYVYKWFEQRKLSYDEIINKYKFKLKNKIQDLYIIKLNDIDIGLVQIYKFNNDIKISNLNKYKNIYEYDVFIGEEKYLNKGIGKEVIKSINKIIFKKYNADAIILRVFKENIRAIKCYEKCNFKKVHEYIGTDTLGNNENIVVFINELERWTFGIDVDKLIKLVLSGKKTATTSLYKIEYLSKIGDISILTDSNNKNICIIQTKKVIVTEFKNINWNLAKLEGENTSLEEWRQVHKDYFSKIDTNFNENTKVIFEVFEVLDL